MALLPEKQVIDGTENPLSVLQNEIDLYNVTGQCIGWFSIRHHRQAHLPPLVVMNGHRISALDTRLQSVTKPSRLFSVKYRLQ